LIIGTKELVVTYRLLSDSKMSKMQYLSQLSNRYLTPLSARMYLKYYSNAFMIVKVWWGHSQWWHHRYRK